MYLRDHLVVNTYARAHCVIVFKSYILCFRLLDTLQEKQTKAEADLSEIIGVLSDISEAKQSLLKVQKQIAEFYVFGENLEETDRDLRQLAVTAQSHIKEAKELVAQIRHKYNSTQHLVPSDVSQELTSLELLAEAVSGAMDEKNREFKKARTVRTDYLSDVEAVESWIKEAELKVQDRSVEPQLLTEHLQQVQSEIGSISDRLEKLIKNGKVILEKTRDDEEKDLIQSTINTLTDQLQQVRSWLEERRQQVSETLDAWQRFLNLYQAVMNWVEEKKTFLKEPLHLSTLQEAKQKLHDYTVSSCKCDSFPN